MHVLLLALRGMMQYRTLMPQGDIEFNNRLCDALKALGVQVVDHFIVANNEYKSMKEAGVI